MHPLYAAAPASSSLEVHRRAPTPGKMVGQYELARANSTAPEQICVDESMVVHVLAQTLPLLLIQPGGHEHPGVRLLLLITFDDCGVAAVLVNVGRVGSVLEKRLEGGDNGGFVVAAAATMPAT